MCKKQILIFKIVISFSFQGLAVHCQVFILRLMINTAKIEMITATFNAISTSKNNVSGVVGTVNCIVTWCVLI